MKMMFRKIVSILMLVAFLMPSIVKVEHHHQHLICKAKNEKHLHVYQDKCEVCSFEFSVFASETLLVDLQNDKPLACYIDNYRSKYHFTYPKFSFQLRAPPTQLV